MLRFLFCDTKSVLSPPFAFTLPAWQEQVLAAQTQWFSNSSVFLLRNRCLHDATNAIANLNYIPNRGSWPNNNFRSTFSNFHLRHNKRVTGYHIHMSSLQSNKSNNHLKRAGLRVQNFIASVQFSQLHNRLKLNSYHNYMFFKNISSYINFHFTKKCHVHTTSQCQAQTVEFMLSDIGEGIREVTIKEWFVSPGDHVSQFDAICEVQSDKAAVTITSRYDGIIKNLHYAVDETALVGKALVDIELEEGESSDSDQAEDMSDQEIGTSSVVSSSTTDNRLSSKVLATPAVRRLAMEKNVSLSSVTGSGKDGRILKEDILAHHGSTMPTTRAASQSGSQSGNDDEDVKEVVQPEILSSNKEDKVIQLRGIRKAMFKSMTAANNIPHFTYSDEINLTRLVHLRNNLKDNFLRTTGVPLSYMPFLLKAMSVALKDYPSLNANLINDDTMVLRHSHNIGIAVDSPDGLVVPCVHNVEDLSIVEIARSLDVLIKTGRTGKLTQGQLSGGTISLSNIGNIGGTYMKPVILPPQVCIGAVGRAIVLPRFDSSGTLIPAHIMNVSWSADHRVVDGATVARFSNHWKGLLEDPDSFIIHLK